MKKIKKSKKVAKTVPNAEVARLLYSIELVEKAANSTPQDIFGEQLKRMYKDLKKLKQS